MTPSRLWSIFCGKSRRFHNKNVSRISRDKKLIKKKFWGQVDGSTWNTLSTWSLAVCSSIHGSAYLPIMLYIAETMSSISSLVMMPSPLMSYKLNAHWSFSWKDPLANTDRPITNSCQSTKHNLIKKVKAFSRVSAMRCRVVAFNLQWTCESQTALNHSESFYSQFFFLSDLPFLRGRGITPDFHMFPYSLQMLMARDSCLWHWGIE